MIPKESRPGRQCLGFGLGGVLLVLVGASAYGQDPGLGPTVYELTEKSTYQTGCFPPCACPVFEQEPVSGTFVLTPTGFDGLYNTYAVTDLAWTVGMGSTAPAITGSGTYKLGGEFALVHRLELDLAVGDEPVQRFDSGFVPGGWDFPAIEISISIHGGYCYDTVIQVDARPRVAPGPFPPRHATFILDPGQSEVTFALAGGRTASKLAGRIQLYLGDPEVIVIALLPGAVGLSVDRADIVALDFQPDDLLPEPLYMRQSPCVRSTGVLNTLDGWIGFELYLIGARGELPVPQPTRFVGTLTTAGLDVTGTTFPPGDPGSPEMVMKIRAHEAAPPPMPEVWFSTEIGFHAGRLVDREGRARFISPGDLLSRRGYVVRTNHELTAHLGIMPIVPDLGLDAAAAGPRGEIWFSFEEDIGRIWSERLGVELKHGDLLSDAGRVVQTNEALIARFLPTPRVPDAGLDAVACGARRAILFSTEQDFYSSALGSWVRHGDLLSNRGQVVRTNAQLMQNFRPAGSDTARDYGLDAVVPMPQEEIWFSTEEGFEDARHGSISDGDLLSTRGYVVARNLDLVSEFGPLEDIINFGLDAVNLVVPSYADDFEHPSDVNADTMVNIVDLSAVKKQLFRPVTDDNFWADVNNDNVVNVADLAAVKGELFTSTSCP